MYLHHNIFIKKYVIIHDLSIPIRKRPIFNFILNETDLKNLPKIFPSPISPVLACAMILSITASTYNSKKIKMSD